MSAATAAAGAIASSGASRARDRLNRAQLEQLGRVVQPFGAHLSAEEILSAFHVPSYALSVEIGVVPIQLMQELARDPSVFHRLDPRQFELTVAEILARHGFQGVKVTPRSGDGGRDVEAHQMLAGIPIQFFFECRRHAPDRPVELSELRALLGVVGHNRVNKGVLVTTSRFTAGGLEFIAENALVDGKDYDDLVGWVANLDL